MFRVSRAERVCSVSRDCERAVLEGRCGRSCCLIGQDVSGIQASNKFNLSCRRTEYASLGLPAFLLILFSVRRSKKKKKKRKKEKE